MSKISKVFWGVIFLSGALLVFPSWAWAGALTFTVEPAENNVDNLTNQSGATWRFTVDNDTLLATNTDAVVITFPEIASSGGSWDFSGVSASSTELSGGALEVATTTIAGIYFPPDPGTITLTLLVKTDQTSPGNSFVVDLKGIVNPSLEQADLGSKTWSLKTCTLMSPNNPSSGCGSDIDSSANASATITRRGGIVDDWSITASNYTEGATGVTYTITFTASTTLEAGEKIWMNFPVGFDITNATTSNQTISGSAVINSTIVATTTDYGLNAVIATTSAAAISSGATVTFTIGNITNHASKGSHRNAKLFTTTANNGLVDGVIYGMETRVDFRPPPVDSIIIGGTNTLIGQAKVREDGALRNLTEGEIAQVRVGLGCPDKMFFVGTKRLDANGRFTYSNLLDATYMLGLMPDNTSDSSFFDAYLQPSFIMVNLTGSETASTSPTFVVPDSDITGTITSGPAGYSSDVELRAYTNTVQAFTPIFNSTGYSTIGLDSSGIGYFQIPVKSGQTWNFSIEPTSITSGSSQYWAPSVTSVYVEPGDAAVSLSAWSFVNADKTLNVTLRDQDGNAVTESGGGPVPCLSIRRAGSEMMGPGGEGVCETTGGVYVLKVPTGAFVVQIMMPSAGFKEYPVTILSTDTTVNKTIIISRPTTYITGTVADPDGFAMQGVSVMAQGSNGSFNQTLTNSSGVYTLYVSTGTYRVEAFAPGYGPLGRQNVTLSGSTATQNFSISTGSFKKITGRVYTDADGSETYNAGDTGLQGVQIRAYGMGGGNGSQSRDDGTYTLMVPAYGNYTVEAWSSTYGFMGKLTNIDASSDTGNNDFITAAQGTLRITITDGNTYGLDKVFAGAFSTSTALAGKGNGSDRWTATSSGADLFTSFSLPAGSYKVDVGTSGFGNLTSLVANYDASSTQITANQTTDLTIVLPGMATLSGTAAVNATVWASRTDGPGKYNTTADSSTGAYSMKIPTGYSYMVGASLPGYVNTPATVSNFSANTTQNLTVALSEHTISGTVSSSAGGNASEGFVWASKANNSGWTGSEVSADGSYSLNIDSGTWTVYADAPCHNSSNGTSQTGSGTKNITLTQQSNCSYSSPEMQSIVPSSGGSVATSGVSVNIPANALGTGSSNVSFSVARPNTVPPATLNAAPISAAAKSITASDSNGTSISSLSNSIEIAITYEDSDIPSGTSEANLQLAYWDTTTNTWNSVSSTVDTDLNIITARVDHLTDFAPVYPTGEGAPDTPSGLAAARSGDTAMSLSWNEVSGATSYLLYRDTASDGSFPYLTTTSNTSASDTSLSGGTTYYYKVSASNVSGESSASGAASAITCSSVSNGTVSGSDCTIVCNSGYTLAGSVCNAIGGGGIISGGGGAGAPTTPPQESTLTPLPVLVTATSTATIVAQPSAVAQLVSLVFNKTLRYGMTSDDISRLQELLATDTEIYPEGIVSGWFGQLTRKAVQRFQDKYGIVSSGSEDTTGYGLVGPSTRQKLQEVFGEASQLPVASAVAQLSPVAAEVSAVFSRGLDIGLQGEDVKRLQQLLNYDSDTRIAGSGVGSSGNETEYFGSLTKRAVERFQMKYGVANEGDPGYGYVGPKTRAKLQEISQKQVQEEVPSQVQSVGQIQSQIQQLLQQIEQLRMQIQAAQGQ